MSKEIFDPYAQQYRRSWRQSGGYLALPATLPGINTTRPREFTFLLDFESAHPVAVEWQVNYETQDPTQPQGGFPNSNVAQEAFAGAYFDSSNIWTCEDRGCIVCKIELGAGLNARTLFTDLRAGRFSLGVQQRVRVSVARWLFAGDNDAVLAIQSTVAPAKTSDADPPTFTAEIVVAGPGLSNTITVPTGAQYFDFTARPVVGLGNVYDATKIFVYGIDSQYYKDSTLAAPVVFPPASPWPVRQGTTYFDVLNLGAVDAQVAMQFWIR